MNTTVYTVDQAADMIGCKPKTIEDRARSGDLPGILWGDGGWRFPAEAFHARLNAIALEQAEVRRQYFDESGLPTERSRRQRYQRQLRTPAWADLDQITALYQEARRLTESTGVRHEVDHVIPLRGACVSGLHVHHNLRVIPAADNRRKSNRFQPC